MDVGGDDEEELDEVDEAEAAASSLSRRFNDSFPFCPSWQRSRLMLLHYWGVRCTCPAQSGARDGDDDDDGTSTQASNVHDHVVSNRPR